MRNAARQVSGDRGSRAGLQRALRDAITALPLLPVAFLSRYRGDDGCGFSFLNIAGAVLSILLLASTASAQNSPQTLPETAPRAAKGKPIPLASPDDQIAGRLRGIFANIDGLGSVTIGVRSGVVR